MTRFFQLVLLALLLVPSHEGQTAETGPDVPRGYYARLEIIHDGQRLFFGPFVGYYFQPVDSADLTRLQFVCYNERRFYTGDQPVNAELFEGEAVLAMLPRVRSLPVPDQRINPIFFDQDPPVWLATRPTPVDEFVHFHSAYNAGGASYTGYWLRHRAVAAFTYDMGGQLVENSPLYHRATPGKADRFPGLIEFDFGPEWQDRAVDRSRRD